MAGLSLVFQTLFSFPFGFLDTTLLVLTYFTDTPCQFPLLALPPAPPLFVLEDPRAWSTYTPSLGELFQPHGLLITSIS